MIPIICDDDCEFLLVSFRFESRIIVLCAIYKSPSYSIQNFLNTLDKILDDHKSIILVGDTNINLLNHTDNNIEAYRSVLACNNIKILNPITSIAHTRKHHNGTVTIIDHGLSSLSQQLKHQLIIGDNTLSDHKYLIISIEYTIKPNESQTLSIMKYNYQKIQQKINNITATNFDIFHKELMSIYEENTYIRTIHNNFRKNIKKPWFQSIQKETKKYKDKYYKLYKKFPQNKYFHQQYHHFKKLLTTLIHDEKKKNIIQTL
jgi:hypothetical protein